MSKLEITGTIVGILSFIGTGYFGIRSMFQSSDYEALQGTVRAMSQGLFNNLWYIGNEAEQALKSTSLTEIQKSAKGVAGISQTARHTLIALSREAAGFTPFYEPAWEPKTVSLPPRGWRRRFFRLQ